MMPVLNPATVQEYLDFGLLGFALSRFSGCWVGFKAIAETVESSASIFGRSAPGRDRDAGRFRDAAGRAQHPLARPAARRRSAGCTGRRWRRSPPSPAPTRSTGIVLDPPRARLGIIATGKAYLDLRQALADLGIDDARPRQLGIRLYKVGLTWPLEATGARRFADGLEDVLVVEEKRGFVEDQLVRILYNLAASTPPSVVGKRDESGARAAAERRRARADAWSRARWSQRLAPARRRRRRRCAQRLARLEVVRAARRRAARQDAAHALLLLRAARTTPRPACPTAAAPCAGIGCHFMALWIPSRRHRRPSRTWAAKAPPGSARRRSPASTHVFQNLGDGTYYAFAACSRSAPRRPRASTSPTRSSTTTRSR